MNDPLVASSPGFAGVGVGVPVFSAHWGPVCDATRACNLGGGPKEDQGDESKVLSWHGHSYDYAIQSLLSRLISDSLLGLKHPAPSFAYSYVFLPLIRCF